MIALSKTSVRLWIHSLRLITFLGVAVVLLQVAASHAQTGDCSALVRQALQLVAATCQAVGRNQVCHGYSQVDAQWRDEDKAQDFEVGAVVDVSNIAALQTSPIDESLQRWGIALLSLQANLPSTLPGENVTLLVLGDTQIQDQGRIYDTNPYQAFRIRTGITGVSCDSVAESGIIIQTPTGAQAVMMQANGVQISFTSTLFVQADPEGEMIISALDGTAAVIAEGVTQAIEFGQRITVPMTEDLLPAGPPSGPQQIATDMVSVPFELLPRAVDSGAIARASGASSATPRWLIADGTTYSITLMPATPVAAGADATPAPAAADAASTDGVSGAVVALFQWLDQAVRSLLPALAIVFVVLVAALAVARLVRRNRGA